MREKKYGFIILILTLIFILTALLAESVYFSDFKFNFRYRRFVKVLREKEKIMDYCLNNLKPGIVLTKNLYGSEQEESIFTKAEENGITILGYADSILVYWSDNEFDVPRGLNDSLFKGPLVFIQNGWFISKTIKKENELIVGLLRITYNYGFENDIINNGFEKGYGLPPNTSISFDNDESKYRVYGRDGTFLFSLLFTEIRSNSWVILIPSLLWIFTLLAIISLVLFCAAEMNQRGKTKYAVFLSLAIFLLVYLVILFMQKPETLTKAEIFSSYRYTLNEAVPSLGHLSLLSVLLSVFAYIFYRYYPLNINITKEGIKKYMVLTLLLIPGALMFLTIHSIFTHLVLNSNICFEPYKLLNLDLFSIIGFISIFLLFLLPFFYILKVFRSFNDVPFIYVVLSFAVSFVLFVIILWHQHKLLIPLSVLFFFITTGIWFAATRQKASFSLTVVFSLIFGLYGLSLITILSEKRDTENIKIQTVAFSTENDPEAEYLLLDMWPRISNDSLLRDMMDIDFFEKDDYDSISDYLGDTYFKGYWGNFNFAIVLCTREDSLLLGGSSGRYEDCFEFFKDRIDNDGQRLTGTDFYFIDNQKGRANYLCRLFYETSNRSTNGLFIDLYSDIKVFQPGYSELLLDRKYHRYTKLKDYSFAKYINGEIVLRTGDFPYDKTDSQYESRNADYTHFTSGGFRHVLYRNGNVTVIISRPAHTIGYLVISFAYLFVFIFVLSNLLLLLIRRPGFKGLFVLNFRQKLQASFIAILLFSFVLIGSVVTALAIKNYKSQHYSNVKEKLYSVYNELEDKIYLFKNISSDWSNYSLLDDILIRLSNIFNTDINIYDLNGYMISTSRPEIFVRKLKSRRMNNISFVNLAYLDKTEFLQKEKIGNLEYISAYMPYYDADDKLVAYLNLPYFRMQSALTRELSNIVVAGINFTLLLILITMSLAVFISNRLTSPLTMLASGLASVKLGRKSKRLEYNSNDEVGDLVRQYNSMLDELDESARKLADSEREYAWREMARQVAHEIKNPLTPMKLNIQQLLKSWKDGIPGFEKKLERFTKNQIEYIDNLSSIASEFSSFAKMPVANPVNLDLAEQIKTTLELFKSTSNITFRIGWPYDSNIYIRADKEHINGIFSNLIKNSIQAIPEGKQGIIKVNLEIVNDKVIASVSDNGTGIPEALREKMFTPNFTTKSSGTGLGLSIVKKYVENIGGRIWFESEAGQGSVFYVEFPINSVVDK